MASVPEVILHRTLVTGLREVRKDSRLLDALFKNLDQPTLQAMKDFITKESINFSLNYPRTDTLHNPSIAILLKNEQEAQTFLGDVMGASPEYDVPDQDLAIDTLGGHGGSVSTLSGLPEKVLGPLRVSSTLYDDSLDRTTIYVDDSHESDMIDFSRNPMPPSDVYVIHGQGRGQTSNICRISSRSLDIEGRFDPYLDSSSLIDIRLSDDPGLAVGEPSRVYPANSTNLLRKGANYDVRYQLSVLADHQDKVLYLYSIVKGILFSQKSFMEEQGLMALKISGTDFAPRTEFLPNEIFQRVMLLDFTYVFSYIEEIEVASKIRLSLEPEDAFTHELCQPVSFDIEID